MAWCMARLRCQGLQLAETVLEVMRAIVLVMGAVSSQHRSCDERRVLRMDSAIVCVCVMGCAALGLALAFCSPSLF